MKELLDSYSSREVRADAALPPLLQTRGKPVAALEGAFRNRKIILGVMLATLVGTGLAGLSVSPDYLAEADLLVLPSSIYSPQADVGGGPPPPTLLDRDTYLKNEVEILSSPAIAEATIRKVGLHRLYPGSSKSFLDRFRSETGSGDPVVRAVGRFSRDFHATADKTGNIIDVTFRNRDAVVAAEVVNAAVALYLQKRGELYDDDESTVVARHVAEQRQRLDTAEKALADFSARYGISNFATQMDILLHQQGDIAHALAQADSDTEQSTERLKALRLARDRVPAQTVMYSETNQQTQIQVLQDSLENLRAQEAGLAVREASENPSLIAVRGQIRATAASLRRLRSRGAPAQVRTGRNPVRDTLDIDVVHAQQDLQGDLARHEAEAAHMSDVKASISSLQSHQPELLRLVRQRDLAAASYQSIVRTLDDRRITESAGLSRSANVRVIQAAEVPMVSSKLRRLILAAGLMLTVFSGAAAAVLCDIFRPGYISPERLERRLGIPVLTSVRDLTASPSKRT